MQIHKKFIVVFFVCILSAEGTADTEKTNLKTYNSKISFENKNKEEAKDKVSPEENKNREEGFPEETDKNTVSETFAPKEQEEEEKTAFDAFFFFIFIR